VTDFQQASDATRSSVRRARLYAVAMVAMTFAVIFTATALTYRWLFGVDDVIEEHLNIQFGGWDDATFAQHSDPFIGFFGKPGTQVHPYGYLMPDEHKSRETPPTYVSTANSLGLRDTREYTLDTVRPTTATRIVLALGDSNMNGANIDDGDTIPERLERLLAASGPVRVINAAFIGSNTLANVIRLKRLVPRIRPDAVVMIVSVNDRTIECEEVGEGRRMFYQALLGLDGQDVPAGQARDKLRAYVAGQIQRRGLFGGVGCNRRPFLTDTERAGLVVDALRAAPGIPFVLINIDPGCDTGDCPVFAQIPAEDRGRVRFFDFQKYLTEIDRQPILRDPRFQKDLARMRARLVRPALLDELDYYVVASDPTYHPNEVGAQLVAERIHEKLQSLGFPQTVAATPVRPAGAPAETTQQRARQ
jgi:lysophospholipase L1-like esterase